MRPRHHAQEIAKLPRKEWAEAVLRVRPEWQELVRAHLRDYVNRRKQQ